MMNKECIIFYLRHPNFDKEVLTEIKNYQEKIEYQQSGLENLKTELYFKNQIKSPAFSENKVRTSYNPSGLENVIIKTENRLKKYASEIQENYVHCVDKLFSQLEEWQRINLIFNTLSSEKKEIITKLYINNEKWVAVESDLDISHSTLVYKLRDIFDYMIKIFDSDISNTTLATQKGTNIVPAAKKTGKAMHGQTTIYDFE